MDHRVQTLMTRRKMTRMKMMRRKVASVCTVTWVPSASCLNRSTAAAEGSNFAASLFTAGAGGAVWTVLGAAPGGGAGISAGGGARADWNFIVLFRLTLLPPRGGASPLAPGGGDRR